MSFNFRSEHVTVPSSSKVNKTKNNSSNNNNNSTTTSNSRPKSTTTTTNSAKPPSTRTSSTTSTTTTNTTPTTTSSSSKTLQFYSATPTTTPTNSATTSTTTSNNSNGHTTNERVHHQNNDLSEYIQLSPYPIIDIGINLTNYQFKDQVKQVLDRCLLANVKSVILTGTSVKSSEQSLQLISKYGNHSVKMYCTLGIHPHDAKTFRNLDELKNIYLKYNQSNNSNQSKIVMIGECGLDFNRMFSSKEEQIKCFKEQIKLGIELNLPLFCHEREAHLDFLNCINQVLKELNLIKLPIPLIVHCFTGNEQELKSYIEMDFYIGLTDFISMNERGRILRDILHLIPLNRLLIETDSPFMLNQKWKFKRNEPCLLPRVLETCLKLYNKNNNKKMTLEDLARQVTRNTCQLMKINENDLI